MIHMKRTIIFGLIICALIHHKLYAQKSPDIKFGKVNTADFDLSKFKWDSGSAAVIIMDFGEVHYEKDQRNNLKFVFTHYRRAKILDKRGFDLASTQMLVYSKGGTMQKITELKAATYNLENGQITQTKLDNKSVFTENYSPTIEAEKFALPAVREGSIIEYSYTLESPIGFNLPSWDFQGKYPCLWSEYRASIPEYFNFVFLTQGYQPYYVNSSSATPSNEYGIPVSGTDHRWAMKDIPAITEENFTSTIKNHIAKIEFQLSAIQMPGGFYQKSLSDWPTISENLMKSENFGADLSRNNGWLDDDLKKITKGSSGMLEKMQSIFSFVRDSFTCTGNAGIFIFSPLKSIFKNKTGSVPEINLLLVAMLNHEGIQADPVILSTRDHGFPNDTYPLIEKYNYVICLAIADSSYYVMDASQKLMAFNHLPEYSYNGQAMVIRKENPVPVYFLADSVKEKKITSVFIINGEKGGLTGSFQTTLGQFGSYDIREKIRKTSLKEYFRELLTTYGLDLKIENEGIDSLHSLDDPVSIHFDFILNTTGKEDMIYFTPSVGEIYRENPLKSTKRVYPVEMSSAMDYVYVLDMEIPTGYQIEEMPKPTKITLNETDGFFEYLIQRSETNIQLRTRVKLNKAFFPPEEYNTLRDFFNYIVEKQSEQIVFKKKK